MAKTKAYDILVKSNGPKKLNTAPITRKFKDITNTVVRKLKDEKKTDKAKPIYKDYIIAIETYLIPELGKYDVNSFIY